jgi:hypothetical protein
VYCTITGNFLAKSQLRVQDFVSIFEDLFLNFLNITTIRAIKQKNFTMPGKKSDMKFEMESHKLFLSLPISLACLSLSKLK